MSVATPSRADMRQWVGALGGWLVNGRTYNVTAVPTPSQFYSTETPWQTDGDAEGLTVYIVSGAASAQQRTVASHTAGLMGSGSLYRLDRAFASTPSTNSVFELWKGATPDMAHRAIDSAVQAAQLRILLPYEDRTSLDLTKDTYEYAVPSEFAYLSEVWLENGGIADVFDEYVPQNDGQNWIWTVERVAGTNKLVFSSIIKKWFADDPRDMKLVGQRYPALPTSDSSAIETDPEYVRLQAAIELTDMLGGPSDRELSRYRRWAAQAGARLERMGPAVLPGSIPVEVV